MQQQALLALNWVLANKDTLLALVGGSAGLSIIAQWILHKLNTKLHINSKAFSYTLVQALTLIASLTAYLSVNASFLQVYPWLAVLVATMHRYMVSPYYTNKILPYLEYEASQDTSVSQPQVAPAVAPALEEVTAPTFVS